MNRALGHLCAQPWQENTYLYLLVIIPLPCHGFLVAVCLSNDIYIPSWYIDCLKLCLPVTGVYTTRYDWAA